MNKLGYPSETKNIIDKLSKDIGYQIVHQHVFIFNVGSGIPQFVVLLRREHHSNMYIYIYMFRQNSKLLLWMFDDISREVFHDFHHTPRFSRVGFALSSHKKLLVILEYMIMNSYRLYPIN